MQLRFDFYDTKTNEGLIKKVVMFNFEHDKDSTFVALHYNTIVDIPHLVRSGMDITSILTSDNLEFVALDNIYSDDFMAGKVGSYSDLEIEVMKSREVSTRDTNIFLRAWFAMDVDCRRLAIGTALPDIIKHCEIHKLAVGYQFTKNDPTQDIDTLYTFTCGDKSYYAVIVHREAFFRIYGRDQIRLFDDLRRNGKASLDVDTCSLNTDIGTISIEINSNTVMRYAAQHNVPNLLFKQFPLLSTITHRNLRDLLAKQ